MSVRPGIEPFLQRNNTRPPLRLAQRYTETRFLPEAGNTVVCHLDFDDPAHQHVLKARDKMRALPEADAFLYTPADSLHMTVFEGVIETRRTVDAWPAGHDRASSVESVTGLVAERLSTFTPPPTFAVRVAGLRPTGLELTGATREDDIALAAWREALTTPFGFRHADHDEYRFHMTFAYPVRWLPDDLLDHWTAEFDVILKDLITAMPVLPLRPPAFCRFADMTLFEEILSIDG